MKLAKIGARYANSKKRETVQKPLEWHIGHLHEEVSEVFGALRQIQDGEIGGVEFDPQDPPFNPFSYVWDKAGHPEGFGIELADVVMIAALIAELTGVDLEAAIERKLSANEGKRAR